MKNKIKSSHEWWIQAEYDLKNADLMFNNGSYLYTVFMCHLAIEKAIKSLYTQVLGQVPPKTHNLVYLALKTDLEFPEEWELFLQKLTRVSVPTRYPEDLSKLLKQYNRETAHKIIGQTRELMKWLQSKLSE